MAGITVLQPEVVLVAKTLCRTAAAPDARPCPYCDAKGQCQREMWSTFVEEAAATIRVLRAAGHMRAGQLPGLGG